METGRFSLSLPPDGARLHDELQSITCSHQEVKTSEWHGGVHSVRGCLQQPQWSREFSNEMAGVHRQLWPPKCRSLGHDLVSAVPPVVPASLPGSFASYQLPFLWSPFLFLLTTIYYCLTSRFLPHSVDLVGKTLRVTNIKKTRATVDSLQEAWTWSSGGGDWFSELETKNSFIHPGWGHWFLRKELM